MSKIEFPSPFKSLLIGSELEAPVRAVADCVGYILADNKLPFFPDYTDHGTQHVNRVLQTEVSLVPPGVWTCSTANSNPRLLCDTDAAVIIVATMFHDLAMHLHPNGFCELMQQDTRFKPLRWFNQNQEGHAADTPWHELWEDYSRSIRRLDDRSLGRIVGKKTVRSGWKFVGLSQDTADWDTNDHLVVGELLRRHHARLAHEIAIYGFPGVPIGLSEGQFPALGTEDGHPLRHLADLIGLVARSHGSSLRTSYAYLVASDVYGGTPRPSGAAALYAMALLRVADYLQIDRQRAPAVLLQLRQPPSPISVMEWKKHQAVQSIDPALDPWAKMVTVSPGVTLELYLQLEDLLAAVQAEIDHATAVLDEVYGPRSDLGLEQLKLSVRRVYSNLHSHAYRDNLPYVPERTGFAADPNLLTLLVEPLYGRSPTVGVRELVQNAVDAVSELQAHIDRYRMPVGQPRFAQRDCDVLVDFVERDNNAWVLRVSDNGVGMTSSTIRNYFLRAGASFRNSREWGNEFLNTSGRPTVIRAGRFGVGAFAIFLLGQAFRLSTRHYLEPEDGGFLANISVDAELIEIRRANDLPIGTTIEVDLAPATAAMLGLDKPENNFFTLAQQIDWFCWDWPRVTKQVTRGTKIQKLRTEYTAPLRRGEWKPEWFQISSSDFDVVFWTFSDAPALTCNGMRIASPGYKPSDSGFDWPKELELFAPCVAVLDSRANLPLTIQRYALSRQELPFEAELTRDVALSFIAHALICGPTVDVIALETGPQSCLHPLAFSQTSTYGVDAFRTDLGRIFRTPEQNQLLGGRLRWCSTDRCFLPVDETLFQFFGSESYVVYGTLDMSSPDGGRYLHPKLSRSNNFSMPVVCWDAHVETNNYDDEYDDEEASEIASRFLGRLCRSGIRALTREIVGARVVASALSHLSLTFQDPIQHRCIPSLEHDRNRYELTWGEPPNNSPAEDLLIQCEMFDDRCREQSEYRTRGADFLYAAEFRTAAICPSTESFLAQIWIECLGRKAIPFDINERRELIERSRVHKELAKHIRAWEEMRESGSKYAAPLI